MYNTTTLIEAIKRNILVTSNSSKFNDVDYIAFLNEQLRWLLESVFIQLNEDFFVDSVDITLVGGQSDYNIPEKAASWAIKSIYYKDANGITKKLNRWTRREEYQGSNTSPIPNGAYIKDNKLITIPAMSTTTTGYISLEYERILNLLTELSSCGVVQSVIDTGTNYQVTVDSIPIGYTSGVDFINPKNPYELIAKELTASVAGSVITVIKTGFDRAPIAGDYVAQTGYTPIPHIPSEFHPILAQAASVKCLAAMGDSKNYGTAQAELNTMIDQMINVS